MKRVSVAILTFLTFLCGISSIVCGAEDALKFEARSAILMEASTGRILYEHNANERLAPASVTKVMTMFLVYEALLDGRISYDDVVTVSAAAASMGGSQIFLEPMEKQSVRDLLKSVVIASANDAAVALAEFISGSEDAFVGLMNKTAADMGLKDTAFKNSCGLDADGHYMSARDIAVLTSVFIEKHPQVVEFSTIWMDSITHRTAKGESEFGLTNTNKLIRWYDGATGLKTGSTGKALYCLSGTAERDGMNLVAVVLAAPSPQIRFGEVMKLLDHGFANYKVITGDEPGFAVGEIPVEKGENELVSAITDGKVSAVVAKGAGGEVEAKRNITAKMAAPVEAGQKLGEITYTYNGEEIGKSDVVAAEDVARAGFGDMMRKMPKLWF
ncbi:MAG: D-alanyl-D-alanine carboxypeptidase [Defluviitaleaceae bacterium]|nr:D-alanyl-D-alanine carboxypeptidase [Defluviitaleaceae bacterium]